MRHTVDGSTTTESDAGCERGRVEPGKQHAFCNGWKSAPLCHIPMFRVDVSEGICDIGETPIIQFRTQEAATVAVVGGARRWHWPNVWVGAWLPHGRHSPS